MPKPSRQRFYYRNGRRHAENQVIAEIFHGVCRVWHRNGQLAQALRYRHGLMHGVSREWDERGRLLGSFTMVHGTGLQQYHYDNGQLQSEITSRNGKFHGRCRGWLRDGTLIQENYFINQQVVTRSAYLKAARENPDWPQYEGEPLGKVTRRSAGLERKEFVLFVQSVLAKPDHADARTWLKAATRPQARSLAKFATTSTALKFVEKLYAAGAMDVIIAAIYAGKQKRLFADWLLIQLPSSKSKRSALRNLCQGFCQKRGGAVMPEKDLGESHLYLMLA